MEALVFDECEEFTEEIRDEIIAQNVQTWVDSLENDRDDQWEERIAQIQYDKDTLHTFSYRVRKKSHE